MIRLKGHCVTYGEVWFDEETPPSPGVDVLVYQRRDRPIADARTVLLHSMQHDLSCTLDEIQRRLHDTCRYQIRRAESKDGLSFEQIADPAARLGEFAAFYDQFVRQKLVWAVDRQWLAAAAAEGQLTLTCATRRGEQLVWHAYMRSGAFASLEYSASLYRGGSAEYRALAGRANRWLHWQDMIALKADGVRCYDWGGLFADESTPERAGINEFKRTFGGIAVRSYQCSLPVTLRGCVWLPVRETWRKWKQPARHTGPRAATAARSVTDDGSRQPIVPTNPALQATHESPRG
jgi:hypothetical protein